MNTKEIDLEAPISTLGLDSMGTLTLVCQIEDKIEKKLPLVEVIDKGRTIRQLTKILSQTNWSLSSKSLVAIQPNGAKPPFFCIHPAGGNVVGYAALANYLGSDQPFYALQSPDLVAGQAPISCFEDMAKHYLSENKELQPEGPYFLGGFCLGGMIDPRNPPALLNAISNQALDHWIPISERTEELRILREEAKGKPPITIPDNLVPDDPILKRVMKNNEKARDLYLPTIYSGSVTIFWANQTPGDLGFYHDPRVCWNQLAGGGLEIHEIGANHFELLEEPHIHNLANKIKLCLDLAQSSTSPIPMC